MHTEFYDFISSDLVCIQSSIFRIPLVEKDSSA